MTCTCRSFPDRMCACHLSGQSHKDCGCACPSEWPTRGVDSGTGSTWPTIAELSRVYAGLR